MSTVTAEKGLDVHQMSLQQLAAVHPRQQQFGDLIPEGINPAETPEAYWDLRRTLEQFFLAQEG